MPSLNEFTLKVACPVCQVEPGRWCISTKTGTMQDKLHRRRLNIIEVPMRQAHAQGYRRAQQEIRAGSR